MCLCSWINSLQIANFSTRRPIQDYFELKELNSYCWLCCISFMQHDNKLGPSGSNLVLWQLVVNSQLFSAVCCNSTSELPSVQHLQKTCSYFRLDGLCLIWSLRYATYWCNIIFHYNWGRFQAAHLHLMFALNVLYVSFSSLNKVPVLTIFLCYHKI